MLEATLRRDRIVIAAGLAALSLLAWAAITWMDAMPAGGMSSMAMPAMPGMAGHDAPGLAWLIAMWAVMMVAMMLPSAAPMILLFAGVTRRRRQEGRPAVPAAVFTLGYLLIWTAYAAIAGTAQWKLHGLALLSPAMASASPLLAGGLLIAAGIYQWLPIKAACLSHCRSPIGFFSHEWREGVGGALLMGMRHGTYCVGCCWLLMALLFVAGVMNLLWVAALAGLVLLEKLVRGGPLLGRIAGAALFWWGLWVIWA
jgi:predicted metal-binding membrane protein